MNNTKIHMIFCDVDGTLLPHGNNIVSNDVFSAINQAVSSGVHICIASGRSYSDLKTLFAPVVDDVIFICNDGALAVEKNNIFFSSPLNKSQVACMSNTYKNDYESMILYTKDHVYCLGKNEFEFAKKITPDEICSISGDIFKVAFLNFSQKAKIKLNNLGIKSGILNKVYEDSLWTEYITAQTDKGIPAMHTQNRYGISISETAAFGDNLNDIGMLRRAQFTYAPKNANPEIIKMCKYTTSNVAKEILNII